MAVVLAQTNIFAGLYAAAAELPLSELTYFKSGLKTDKNNSPKATIPSYTVSSVHFIGENRKLAYRYNGDLASPNENLYYEQETYNGQERK